MSVVAFIEGLSNPLQLARRHLEAIVAPARNVQSNLSQTAGQAARTGATVEAGALAGAAGLRVMASAALIGLAAVVALGKAWEGFKDTAASSQAAGVGAAAAGMPVERYTAVAQALFQGSGNVPQEETQAWLSSFGQLQQQVKLGLGNPNDPRFAALGLLGIGPFDSPEEILRKFALRTQGETQQQVVAQGASIGLSAAAALELQRQGPNFERNVTQAEKTAVTDRDVAAAKEFNRALAEMQVEFRAMYRELFLDVEPALLAFTHGLTAFARDIKPFIEWLFSVNDKLNTVLNAPNALGHYLHDTLWGTTAAPATPGGPPEELVQSIVRAEGSKDTDVSSAGAVGRFQVLPSTAKPYLQPGEDLADPKVNERVGRAYIADLWARYHDAKAVMIAYNSGPANADRWIAAGRDDSVLSPGVRHYANQAPTTVTPVPPQPAVPETVGPVQEYVRGLMGDLGLGPRMEPGVPGGAAPTGGTDTGNVPATPARQHVSMLGGIRSGQLAMNVPAAANANGPSFTFGDVIVNTHATDAAGTAAAVRDTLNRNIQVAVATAGLA